MDASKFENLTIQQEDFIEEFGALHMQITADKRRIKMLVMQNERLTKELEVLKSKDPG